MNSILLYLAAGLCAFWGTAHIAATKPALSGFGDLTKDNRRILVMEWIVEGVALIFIGLLIAVLTYLDPGHSISKAIFWLIFCTLNTLSIISLFTGFKVNFFMYKLCPLIFTGSSLLILFGGIL